MSGFQFEQNARTTNFIPKRFQSYDGKIIVNMPTVLGLKLNDQGIYVRKNDLVERVPADMKGLVEGRVKSPSKNDKEILRNNYYFALDGFAKVEESKGDHMLINSANPVFRKLALGLNPKSPVPNGLLTINDDVYQKIKEAGNIMMISKQDANTFRNDPYDLPNKREEILEFYLQGDSESKEAYLNSLKGGIENNLDFYITSKNGAGLVWFGSVGNNYSGIDCSNDLLDDYGRLLGDRDGVAKK